MSVGSVFLVCAFAIVIVGSCFGFWSQRKRAAQGDLHAPLLLTDEASSADARVESALRAAREGSRTCHRCAFDNLKRSAFCAICGAAASERETSTEALAGLTARQRRVRRRRQWLRGITEESQVRWQSTVDNTGAVTPWVLRMSVPIDSDQPVTVEPPREVMVLSEDLGSSDDVAITVQAENEALDDRVETITTVAARLTACAAVLAVDVQDAVVADAAVPSLTVVDSIGGDDTNEQLGNDQARQEIRDTVVQAQLDFPTKLAQFITGSSTLFLNAATRDDGTTRTSRLTIDRADLLGDSIASIATMTQTEARAAVRIDFVGDQGVDAGGVYREWFLLFNEQILTPEAGLFVCVDKQDQAFYLNPHSQALLGDDHLAHFFAAGRVLGRALLEGNVTGFHLAHPLLKIILGLPIGFDDFEYFDPEAHKNLQWLLDNDGVDALGLDFTVVEKLPHGRVRTVELVPGRSERDVNDENKVEFVDRKIKYMLVDTVAPQLFAFLKGLYEIVPTGLLMLFDAEELDYVLSGSDSIDVDDWERHTKYTEDLTDHPALKHFWQLVRAMSPEQKRLLLQFATGSSRVPPAGFAALSSYDGRLCPFTLYGVGAWQDSGYVRSHACFNRLDLPRLQTKKGMQQALSAALLGEETGFTIQ